MASYQCYNKKMLNKTILFQDLLYSPEGATLTQGSLIILIWKLHLPFEDTRGKMCSQMP